MKKILVTLFVLLYVFCIHAPAQQSSKAQAIKEVNTSCFVFIGHGNVFDLGKVMINSSVSRQFEFKNEGSEAVIITNIRSSSGRDNLQVSWPLRPVKPGKKARIKITYTAGDATGSFQDDIYVTSNVTGDGYRLMRITGAVIPTSNQYVYQYDELPPGQIRLYKHGLWNHRRKNK